MRQLLDATQSHAEPPVSTSDEADDVVVRAAHALDLHASHARAVRATAAQWNRDSRPKAAPLPFILGNEGAAPVPFFGVRAPTPYNAGRTVDRKG